MFSGAPILTKAAVYREEKFVDFHETSANRLRSSCFTLMD